MNFFGNFTSFVRPGDHDRRERNTHQHYGSFFCFFAALGNNPGNDFTAVPTIIPGNVSFIARYATLFRIPGSNGIKHDRGMNTIPPCGP